MRRKYVLAGTNSPGLSDSDGLCRPHPPLRRSPFPKGKVGDSFLGGIRATDCTISVHLSG